MKVTLDMPDWVWAQLADRADAQGVKVADIIGDTLASMVRLRTVRKGNVRRQFTPADNAEVRRLHSEGVTNTVIAELFSVRPQTIHHKLSRWGLSSNIQHEKEKTA